jgi:hypothetical protein
MPQKNLGTALRGQAGGGFYRVYGRLGKIRGHPNASPIKRGAFTG